MVRVHDVRATAGRRETGRGVTASRTKGKWAQGIQPRNFAWIIKERLAICERPGGYGANHRRVRRQEEIIWLREQGFGCVISLLPSPHNLHNYDEYGLPYLHRPFGPGDDPRAVLRQPLPRDPRPARRRHEGRAPRRRGGRPSGRRRRRLPPMERAWCPKGPHAISIIETITGRQLDPMGRSFIALATELPPPDSGGLVVPSDGLARRPFASPRSSAARRWRFPRRVRLGSVVVTLSSSGRCRALGPSIWVAVRTWRGRESVGRSCRRPSSPSSRSGSAG